MSATFSVVVLCPNGRRETVKVSPNSSILKVLEEACLRQNINSEDFELWHYNRPLDLSLPIRFSNLSNNALLEMKAAQNARKEGMVVVCVQMESGERFMKEFHPSTSINDVLLHCLSSDSTTLLLKGEPVCIYMRQKIMGKGLHTTTLRDLGLTKGQAILRLLYRKPEDIQEQAHVSNPLQAAMISDPTQNDQNLKSEQIISKDSRQPETMESCEAPPEKKIGLVKSFEDSSTETDDNSNVAFKGKISPDPPIMNRLSIKNQNSPNRKNTTDNVCDMFGNDEKEINQSITAMDCDSKSEEDFFEGVDDIKYVGERHAVLYSLDDITDNKKADLPDEFFELTIHDAKYLMEEYKKQRKEFENQPLLTKELRERQILQNLSQYSQTVIRVYFPDRVVLQAVFSAIDTVQSVLDFVHHYLEDKSLTYYLYTTPPKKKLKLENRLIESLLIPAAVVYLGSDVICTKYLLDDYKDKLSDPRAAALAASEARKKTLLTTPVDIPRVASKVSTEKNVPENTNPSERTSSSIQKAPQTDKVPKWLKIGKK